MSNSQSNQDNLCENNNSKGKSAESNQQDSYQMLMEEAKQVLDNIHLSSNYQPTFIIQRPTQQSPRLLNQTVRQSSKLQNQQNGSEEEAKEQPIQQDSRKEASQNLHQFIKKSSKIFGCNCLKSKCTKNYCQCFTQGRKCIELCKCTGCENQGEVQKRYRPIMEAEDGEKYCNCKKSNCLKKYCECYNSGVKCNSNCKCEECKNSINDANQGFEEMREQTKKQKSQKEIAEIDSKLEEISKMVPKQHLQYVYALLEYWLS